MLRGFNRNENKLRIIDLIGENYPWMKTRLTTLYKYLNKLKIIYRTSTFTYFDSKLNAIEHNIRHKDILTKEIYYYEFERPDYSGIYILYENEFVAFENEYISDIIPNNSKKIVNHYKKDYILDKPIRAEYTLFTHWVQNQATITNKNYTYENKDYLDILNQLWAMGVIRNFIEIILRQVNDIWGQF